MERKSDNEDAQALLVEVARLMQLNSENPFKVRAFEKAAEALAGCQDWRERVRQGTICEVPGIGKGIEQVLKEYVETGSSSLRQELTQALPAGLLELVQVPGLGAKKATQLIEELGIRSVAELEYACRENRLLKMKGFGPKLQAKLLEGALFIAAHREMVRLPEALLLSAEIQGALREALGGRAVLETGQLRRRMEVLSQLEFLVVDESEDVRVQCEKIAGKILRKRGDRIPVRFYSSPSRRLGYELARTTATSAHWQAIGSPSAWDVQDEKEFYTKLGFPVFPPETRESGEEVTMAQKAQLADLLDWNSVRGVFHNHTTRSDGTASMEEMIRAALECGYEYIGISDHSQTSVYARGLREENLLEQEQEIRELREKYPEIRIFWGIESDILADGSLDYPPKILRKFDFVVASIHSRFNMDRTTMTARILEAVRNPATRFLGHATGRILLGRKGYEIDMEAVIAEAAACNVAIELNANPLRLDIDWRWGSEMRRKKTLTSINPDAHSVSGLKDTWYGVAMARKALFPAWQVVNSRPVKEIEKWLRRQ